MNWKTNSPHLMSLVTGTVEKTYGFSILLFHCSRWDPPNLDTAKPVQEKSDCFKMPKQQYSQEIKEQK